MAQVYKNWVSEENSFRVFTLFVRFAIMNWIQNVFAELNTFLFFDVGIVSSDIFLEHVC